MGAHILPVEGVFVRDKKEIRVLKFFYISVEEGFPLIVGFFIRGDERSESLMILLLDDFSMFEVRMGGKEILLIFTCLISHGKL